MHRPRGERIRTVFPTYFIPFRAIQDFDDMLPSDGIDVPGRICDDPQRRTVMTEIMMVGVDLAKNVFHALAWNCALLATFLTISIEHGGTPR
jgi:hypothetical protein